MAIAPTGKTPVPVRRAEDRLHDRSDGDGDGQKPRGYAGGGKPTPTRRPGTRSASPTSATAASRSSPSRRSRRETSTGRASGKWVHVAKAGFEKYFLRKMRGRERAVLRKAGPQHARHREAEGGNEGGGVSPAGSQPLAICPAPPRTNACGMAFVSFVTPLVLSYPLIFSRAKMQLEVGASLRRLSYDEVPKREFGAPNRRDRARPILDVGL